MDSCKEMEVRDKDATYWIETLGLERHPEGGYFRQTYRSNIEIGREALPARFPGTRVVSTGIYFLLKERDFSAFHRLRSDEMWHFYAGSGLKVHVIEPAGEYSTICLGSHADKGQSFQATVKAGCWFGSELLDRTSYALVGCTVAPGFEFEDFELGKRLELMRAYPQQRNLIERLTRA
jgi:predicted cupin superfamily sugar epimerase